MEGAVLLVPPVLSVLLAGWAMRERLEQPREWEWANMIQRCVKHYQLDHLGFQGS